jgi:hypothetical protein
MSIRDASNLCLLFALGMTACSSSSSGRATTGGSGGMSCDGSGTPAPSCTPQNPSDGCQTCQQQYCCSEWEDCAAQNPSDPCIDGGPDGTGELNCFQSCYINEIGQGVSDPDARLTCAGACATPSCGATVSTATSSLVACLIDNCVSFCFF